MKHWLAGIRAAWLAALVFVSALLPNVTATAAPSLLPVRVAQAARTRTAAHELSVYLSAKRHCFAERQVHVKSDGAMLYGKLTVPMQAGPAPGILFVPGSGSIDLNGDVGRVRNHMYEQLAYALSCHGYAVLRYDKRGIGRSTGEPYAVTTIDDERDDVLALLKTLGGEDGVDGDRLVLMGHSEGGLVAPYSAPRAGPSLKALVLLEAPGEPIGKLIVKQVLFQAQAHGASKQELAKQKSLTLALLDAIRKGHAGSLEVHKMQEFPLAYELAPAARRLRSEMPLDPSQLLHDVKLPVLVVQGGADVQVWTADAKTLTAAAPHAKLFLLPHMTHFLIRAHGSPEASARPPPGARLDPQLVPGLVRWLDATVAGG